MIKKEALIDGVKFGNVDIHIDGKGPNLEQMEIGSITLEYQNRSFVLDVPSHTIRTGTLTDKLVDCEVAPDLDTFPEHEFNKYDLTKEDIGVMSHGEMQIDLPYGFEIKAIQLWYTADEEYKYIELVQSDYHS